MNLMKISLMLILNVLNDLIFQIFHQEMNLMDCLLNMNLLLNLLLLKCLFFDLKNLVFYFDLFTGRSSGKRSFCWFQDRSQR